MNRGVTGFGIGFRTDHFDDLLNQPTKIDWLEIITDNLLTKGDRFFHKVAQIAEHFPITFHGVGLSVAGVNPIDCQYLESLKWAAKSLNPRIISDHLCWSTYQGKAHYDLLPIPYQKNILKKLTERVCFIQDTLGQRLYLENPSAYLAYATNEMSEAEFLAALADQSECGILLDINNLFVNHCNLHCDIPTYLRTLQGIPICYIHLAGHRTLDGIRIDTHDEPICDSVWEIFQQAVATLSVPATMIEWDADIPPLSTLVEQLDTARHHYHVATLSRGIDSPIQGASPEIRQTMEPPQNDSLVDPTQERLAALIMCAEDSLLREFKGSTLPLSEQLPVTPLRGITAYRDNLRYGFFDLLCKAYPILLDCLGEEPMLELNESFLRWNDRPDDLAQAVLPFPDFLSTVSNLKLPQGISHRQLVDIGIFEATLFAMEQITPSTIASWSTAHLTALSQDQWPELKLAFVPSLRLLLLQCSPHLALDQGMPIPVPKDFFTPAIYRLHTENDAIHYEVLDAMQHTALRLFLQGHTFQQVVGQIIESTSTDGEGCIQRQIATLVEWVYGWTCAGIVEKSTIACNHGLNQPNPILSEL